MFLVIAGLIALPTAIVTVVLSVSLVGAQADQDAYDKAPLCTAGSTNSHDCALQTSAKVESVYAFKNTGKNARGYTTEAELSPDHGASQTVTVSSSENLTYYIHDGDIWPVLVWRDKITRFTYAGKTHDSDENPHHIVAELLIGIPACLAAASLFGRIVLRSLLRARIAVNPARNRIPDWMLTGLVPATVITAALMLSWLVTTLALLAVAVLIGSAAVWPFLPWVMQPDPESLLGQKKARSKANKAKPARRLP